MLRIEGKSFRSWVIHEKLSHKSSHKTKSFLLPCGYNTVSCILYINTKHYTLYNKINLPLNWILPFSKYMFCKILDHFALVIFWFFSFKIQFVECLPFWFLTLLKVHLFCLYGLNNISYDLWSISISLFRHLVVFSHTSNV